MDLEAKTKIKFVNIGALIGNANFDEALEILSSVNCELISLPQIAQLRIQLGKNSYFSRNGNYTREAFIYSPKKGAFLTKNSPIINNVNNIKEAVQAHKKGIEYFLTDEQVEQALSNSVRLVGRKIPTNRFKENEITAFAFEEIAEQYGNFLYESGVKEMPVYLSCFSKNPFARQMKFMSLSHKSAFNSIGKFFGDLKNLEVCGVKK